MIGVLGGFVYLLTYNWRRWRGLFDDHYGEQAGVQRVRRSQGIALYKFSDAVATLTTPIAIIVSLLPIVHYKKSWYLLLLVAGIGILVATLVPWVAARYLGPDVLDQFLEESGRIPGQERFRYMYRIAPVVGAIMFFAGAMMLAIG